MKTVREVMSADVIRVGPTNKIKTAIILMKGHKIGGLPVMEGDRVLGMLDYQDVLGKDNDVPVQNLMDKEFVTIPPEMLVIDAAELMSIISASRLLVMDQERLVGVVTRGDLLPELGKSFDPITGLPRADAMRDWGIDALKSGREITVIFIDLDKFGQYNKLHGHIVGDRILQHVAKILTEYTDKERDMVCRYAGDEFVIVTDRYANEAQELAQVLESAISSTPNDELPGVVTASFGLHGGMRTKEREDVHYNSTLDNLINLASKACTMAKYNKFQAQVEAQIQGVPQAEHTEVVETLSGAEAVQALAEADALSPEFEVQADEMENPEESASASAVSYGPAVDRRLKLRGLNFSWDGTSMATAEVTLANGGVTAKESRSGFAMGNNALRLVAEATAQAVCQFLSRPGYGVVTESVQLLHLGENTEVVLATALVITPQNQLRVSGSCLVKQDAYRSVCAAFLNAVNRQVALFLG
jgi:diguanylate cyclase (GGDEF)-like protein